MTKLLITGARGFVGRACVERACELGFEVHATSRGMVKDSGFARSRAHWHNVNLLNSTQLLNLLDLIKPSHVLHTAWETTHGSYWQDLHNLDWLSTGTVLMKWSVENNIDRLVCVGSCAEYEWSDRIFKETESLEVPHTFYGCIKLAHHKALMATASQHGLSAATGRIFFGYGPNENVNRIVPYCCRRLIEDKEAVFSSCDFYRDFMHIDDIADGLMSLLASNYVGSCNICSGQAVLLRHIIEIIGDIAGKSELIKLGAKPDRADDVNYLVGDNSTLKSFGWQQSMSLEDGLSSTYDWWKFQSNKL